MASTGDTLSVETEDEYVHVRFGVPDEFNQIRALTRAQRAAESVSTGAEV